MDRKILILIASVLLLLGAGVGLWFVLTRDAGGPRDQGTQVPGSTLGDVREEMEDRGPYHEIAAAYPVQTQLRETAGASLDASASATMKSFVLQEVARFKDNNITALTEEDIRIQNLGGERLYALAIDYTVYVSEDTVSYVFSMYADTLGAHPNGYYRTFTFDKASGAGLALDDLFAPSANHLEVLSMLAREKLAASLGEYDAEYLEAGTTPDADNFQNFYLEGDTLVLLFPPYQVGPWVIGTQTAVITRAELGNTLREEYR